MTPKKLQLDLTAARRAAREQMRIYSIRWKDSLRWSRRYARYDHMVSEKFAVVAGERLAAARFYHHIALGRPGPFDFFQTHVHL